MKSISLLAIYGFASLTAADNVSKTAQTCQTYYGQQSIGYVPRHTSYFTTTIAAPTYVTTHSTTTSTPAATTITDRITTTTTTQSTVTGTFTQKVTSKTFVTNICTQTSYTTTYATVTATGAQETATITAPAGFIYPSPPAVSKRDAEDEAELGKRTYGYGKEPSKFSPNPFSQRFKTQGKAGRCLKESPYKYPAYVNCRNDITVTVPQVVKITGSVVTETACQPTVMKTLTETATSTLCARTASVTITSTTTATCTTDVLTTTTSAVVMTRTATISPPKATYYAQCGPMNQVSKDSSGNRIALFAEAGADFNPTIKDAKSAYDCCVACILNNEAAAKDSSAKSYCGGSNFVAATSDYSVQSCQLNLYSTCSTPVTQSKLAMKYYSHDLGVDVVISNGPAGYYQYVDSNGKSYSN